MSPRALSRHTLNDDVLASNQIEGSFTWTTPLGRVQRKVRLEEIGNQLGTLSRSFRESNRWSTYRVGNAKELRLAIDHEVLPASDDVLGELFSKEADRVIPSLGLSPPTRYGNGEQLLVVQKHTIVIGFDPMHFANEVIAKILPSHRPMVFVIVLWPYGDLPKKTVVPHELAGPFQGAMIDSDIVGIGCDLSIASNLRGS